MDDNVCCISSDEEGDTSAADVLSHEKLTEALEALQNLQLILGICLGGFSTMIFISPIVRHTCLPTLNCHAEQHTRHIDWHTDGAQLPH